MRGNNMTLTVITNPKICPLSNASDKVVDCSEENCAWYITDDGKEECAIVKLAKGWCM